MESIKSGARVSRMAGIAARGAGGGVQEGETADTSRQSSCAACSIPSGVQQGGATLVVNLNGGAHAGGGRA